MRTLRTVPAVLRQLQVLQMPIRHPWSGVSPASSACSSRGSPLFAASRALAAKLTVPSAPSAIEAHRRGRECLGRGSGRPSCAQTARTASINAGGPHTKVAALGVLGDHRAQVLAPEASAQWRRCRRGCGSAAREAAGHTQPGLAVRQLIELACRRAPARGERA